MHKLKIPEGLSWPVVLVVLFAVGIRLAYSHDLGVPLEGDAANYVGLAGAFKEYGLWGPDASRPPFYCALLALTSIITHVPLLDARIYLWLNCVFDSLSIFLLFRLARRLAPSIPPFGVVFVAISPLWFGHVNVAVTEPLSVTLFVAFLERWTREARTQRDEIWSGVYLGLLALTRGVFSAFPIGLLVFECLYWKAPKGARLLDLKRRAIFLASSYTLPVLWGFRNLHKVGQFIMTQDGKTAILMAWSAIKIPTLDWRIDEHSKYMYTHPWSDVLLGRADAARTEQVYGLMRAEVIDFIQHHPVIFIENFFIKLARLWVTGWWNPFSYTYSPPYLRGVYIGGFCLPVLILGAAGLGVQYFARKSENGNPLATWRATRTQLFTVIFLSAIALPFTVDARYSLPAYVTFGLWFSVGWAKIAAVGLTGKPLSPRLRSGRTKAST